MGADAGARAGPGGSLVRFRDQSGTPIGAGFLLPDGHVCTCAHVVTAALELAEPQESPTERLTADLPFLGTPAPQAEMKVVEWSPEDALDVAILDPCGELPDGAKPIDPVRGDRIGGRRLKAYGFPKGHPEGVWSKDNQLGDAIANGMVQFEASKTEGQRVQPGFSGAPVWDEETGEAVGMVVVTDRDPTTKVAFLTPNYLLAKYAPVLAGGSAVAPYAHLTDGLSGLHGAPLPGIEDFLANYLGRPDAPVPFGGRERELAELDDWLDDHDAHQCALLVAEAGRGKSALLAKWIDQVARSGRADVAFVPISIRFRTGRRATTLTALGARLAFLLGIDTPPVRSPDDWLPQLDNYLRRDRTSARPLLIAIDGADEGVDWDFDLSFPATLGQGVKIIVSARRLAERDMSGWAAHLSWTGRFKPIELGVLDADGLRSVLESMGNPLAGLATNVDIVTELLRLTRGDPLLVRLYVEALVGSDERAAFLRADELPDLGAGLEALMDRWWDELRAQWKERKVQLGPAVATVRDVLAHALGPLLWSELDVLCAQDALDRDQIEEAVETLNRFVVGDGRTQGFVFSHPLLADFFRDRRSADVRSWENRFVELGRRTLAGLEDGSIAPDAASPYALQYYDEHLDRVDAPPEELRALVCDGWRRAWNSLEGTYDGFLDDVSRAWELDTPLPANAADRAAVLARQIRYGLIHASVHSLAARLPADLVELLLSERLWTPELALAHARRVSDMGVRAVTLRSIAPYLPLRLVPEALGQLAGDQTAPASVGAASALVTRVWREDRAAARELLEGLSGEAERPQLRGAVARMLAQDGDLDGALAVAAELPAFERVLFCYPDSQTGSALDSGIRATLEARALADAATIEDPERRATALTHAGQYESAPEEWLDLTARSLEELAARAGRSNAVRELLHRVPSSDRESVASSALWALRNDDLGAYDEVLRDWEEAIADAGGEDVLSEVVRRAARVQHDTGPESAQWVMRAIRRAPPVRAAKLAEAAVDQLMAEGRGEFRLILLKECVPHLSEAALERALGVPFADSLDTASAVETIAPRLTERSISAALDAAIAIDDVWSQGKAIESLAPRLSEALSRRALEHVRSWDPSEHVYSLQRAEVPLLLRVDPAAAVGSYTRRAADTPTLSEGPRPLTRKLLELGRPDLVQTLARDLPPGAGPVEVLTEAATQAQGDERRALARQALEAAQTVADEDSLLNAVAPYAPHCGDSCLHRLLDAIDEMDATRRHAYAASHVAASVAARVPTRARALAVRLPVEARIPVLVALAASDGFVDDIRAGAAEATHPGRRVVLLAAAMRAGSDTLRAALLPELRRAFAEAGDRGLVFGAANAIDVMPEGELEGFLAQLSAEASRLAADRPEDAARIVGATIPWLPADRRAAAAVRALEYATGIEDEVSRALVMSALAEHLPPEGLDRLLGIEFADAGWRAEVLGSSAPYLSDRQLDAALEITEGFQSSYPYGKALAPLLGEVAKRGRAAWALDRTRARGRVELDAVLATAPALDREELERAWSITVGRPSLSVLTPLVLRALEVGAIDLAVGWTEAMLDAPGSASGTVVAAASVAPHTDDPDEWTRRAMALACGERRPSLETFEVVLPLVADRDEAVRYELLSSAIRELARLTRAEFLSNLGALAPAVLEFGPTTVADGLVGAVIEARVWFP